MALDEQQDNDMTFTDRNINYVIEKDLFDKAKPIRIDFVESLQGSGFQLTSSLPAGGGCC
jgi:Fe-S cluster assembly iron-binding protein IscA